MSYSHIHNKNTHHIIATICVVVFMHILVLYTLFVVASQKQSQKQPQASLNITFINNTRSDVSDMSSRNEKKTHSISQEKQQKDISDYPLKNVNKIPTKPTPSETHTKQEPTQQNSDVKTGNSKKTSTEKDKPSITEEKNKKHIKTDGVTTANNQNKDNDNTSDKSSDSNVAFGALLQNKRFHHVNQHNLPVIGTSQNSSDQTVSKENNSKQHNSRHHDGQQQETTADEELSALSDEEMEKILDEWIAEENALLVTVPMAQIVTEAAVTYPSIETSREGFVVFEFIIDPVGKVIVESILVIDATTPEFIEPATQALLESTFQPIIEDAFVTSNTVRYQFDFTPPAKPIQNEK